MTPTQIELLNSPSFWLKRYHDQTEYCRQVLHRVKAKQYNADRKLEVFQSAKDVLRMVNDYYHQKFK